MGLHQELVCNGLKLFFIVFVAKFNVFIIIEKKNVLLFPFFSVTLLSLALVNLSCLLTRRPKKLISVDQVQLTIINFVMLWTWSFEMCLALHAFTVDCDCHNYCILLTLACNLTNLFSIDLNQNSYNYHFDIFCSEWVCPEQ